jgi:high-affinity Fe2+/Pb2+ permease
MIRRGPWACSRFLAVFREGAEAVLSMTALASTEGGWTLAICSGLVAGAAALVILFVLLYRLARRIPLRPLLP